MHTHRVHGIFESIASVRALVAGDFILDRYVFGQATGISYEAPVPSIRIAREELRAGGAAFAARCAAALGARVSCCGWIGTDSAGDAIRRELRSAAIDADALVPTSRTAERTRFFGFVQSAERAVHPVLHVERDAVVSSSSAQLAERIRIAAADCDVLILSDSGKGALSDDVIAAGREAAESCGVPVVVDPYLGLPLDRFAFTHTIIVNRFEAAKAAGVFIDSQESCRKAAQAILKMTSVRSVVITLDKDGMFLCPRGGRDLFLPTIPQQAYDVAGAGDVVTCAFAVALGAGATEADAAELANIAAGLEVQKIGAAPVLKEEIVAAVLRAQRMPNAKLKTTAELLPLLEMRRANGEKVVFTNGCFDILHVGHIEYIKYAREQGDLLVLGLNTDESIRAIKGPARPILNEEDRARVLAALEDIDYIVLFGDPTPQDLIEAVRPDVLVKGEDWREKGVVGREFVESYGGKVVLAPLVNGISTSNIVDRILEKHRETAASG